MSHRDKFRKIINETNTALSFDNYDPRHEELIIFGMSKVKDIMDYFVSNKRIDAGEEAQAVFLLAKEKITDGVYNYEITSESEMEDLFYDSWFYDLVLEAMRKKQ